MTCPECGETVEVSAKVWLVMNDDGSFEPGFDHDFTSEESTFYCMNDHNLDVHASDNGWYDLLRDWIEPRLDGRHVALLRDWIEPRLDGRHVAVTPTR